MPTGAKGAVQTDIALVAIDERATLELPPIILAINGAIPRHKDTDMRIHMPRIARH